ncbi:hypothetical protein H5410_011685 [Solanum commersonii]|uniref:Uncharacterized protein n=1 Tax=Solanum commersonii TaxID=4109 RepID=A0A9J6AQD3_SOLCO|nr:hypothetical protein H5410_011685 [Solanum commersonii]
MAPLRFTIRDFAIISGRKAITKSRLVEKFDNKVGDNDDDAEIAVKVSHHIPRILNGRQKRFPRLSYFAKGMFRGRQQSNITQLDGTQDSELPPEYVQSIHLQVEAADPPCPINNKGKEKVDSCLSPPKKKSNAYHSSSYDKVRSKVVQSEEPSQHLPLELNPICFNDLNDQEKVVRVSVPSSTPDVSIHQSKLHSPAGQSIFSPLVQQFSNPEPLAWRHTPLPIHRESVVPFNTSPYVTSFCCSSSSRFHFSFDLKHPFVAMSDLERTTLYIHFWKWLNEGLLEWQRRRYKRTSHLTNVVSFWNCQSKTSGSIGLHTKINCLMTRRLQFDVDYQCDAYYNFESNINKEVRRVDYEYISGSKCMLLDLGIIDNILIPVNIRRSFIGF